MREAVQGNVEQENIFHPEYINEYAEWLMENDDGGFIQLRSAVRGNEAQEKAFTDEMIFEAAEQIVKRGKRELIKDLTSAVKGHAQHEAVLSRAVQIESFTFDQSKWNFDLVLSNISDSFCITSQGCKSVAETMQLYKGREVASVTARMKDIANQETHPLRLQATNLIDHLTVTTPQLLLPTAAPALT